MIVAMEACVCVQKFSSVFIITTAVVIFVATFPSWCSSSNQYIIASQFWSGGKWMCDGDNGQYIRSERIESRWRWRERKRKKEETKKFTVVDEECMMSFIINLLPAHLCVALYMYGVVSFFKQAAHRSFIKETEKWNECSIVVAVGFIHPSISSLASCKTRDVMNWRHELIPFLFLFLRQPTTFLPS